MTNNKHSPQETDSHFLQSLISEAQEESESREMLSEIKEMLPTLKQFHEDVTTAQDNIINLRLGTEYQLRWYKGMEVRLAENFDVLCRKIDAINSHLDSTLANISKKLVVAVTVSDADRKAIQAEYDNAILHMQELHAQQMEELRKQIDCERQEQMERHNQWRHDLHEKMRCEDGLYLSGPMYWIGTVFFWIGVIVVVVTVAVGITRNV